MNDNFEKTTQNTDNIGEKGRRLLGFRSNKMWKKVLSVSYLIFCGIFTLFLLFEGRKEQVTVYDFWIYKVSNIILILGLFCPYIFLSNTKLRDKLPLFKKHSTGTSICGITAVITVLLIVAMGVDSAHSEEYTADMKNHAYVQVSSKVATCEDDGEIKYHCEYCGKDSTELIDKLGHNMVEVSRKEPTEKRKGEVINKCSVCEKQETVKLDKLSETNNTTATPETAKETVVETTQNSDSSYSKLNDSQFALLTEMLAKSFYTLTLPETDIKKVDADSAVSDCLKQIYYYAIDNYFELDPEYTKVFSARYDVVSKISNYDTLEENFFVGYAMDYSIGKFAHTIKSYSLNKDDVYMYDDTMYLDANGYLNKGVILYWLEDKKMVVAGEIKDIAYNKEVDGTTLAYAININYYDDPASSGWHDGETFLKITPSLTGKPVFYVKAQDANRKIQKEEIDFSGEGSWLPLKKSYIKKGTKVYLGSPLSNTKSYIFTIEEVSEELDIMIVTYPDGSTEEKSYSSMMEKDLYTKS